MDPWAASDSHEEQQALNKEEKEIAVVIENEIVEQSEITERVDLVIPFTTPNAIRVTTEQSGILFKHIAYRIDTTLRRYSDFTWLSQTLAQIYPFRLRPLLPQKLFMPSNIQLQQRLEGLSRYILFLTTHPLYAKDPLVIGFMSDASIETLKSKYTNAKSELSGRNEVHEPPSQYTGVLERLRVDLVGLLEVLDASVHALERVCKIEHVLAGELVHLSECFDALPSALVSVKRDNADIMRGLKGLARNIQGESNVLSEACAEKRDVSLASLKRYQDVIVSLLTLITIHDQTLINLSIQSYEQRLSTQEQKIEAMDVLAVAAKEKLKARHGEEIEELASRRTVAVFVRMCVWEELGYVDSRAGEFEVLCGGMRDGGTRCYEKMLAVLRE